jgi:hypothetical protein
VIKRKLILFVLCFLVSLTEGKSQEINLSKNSIFFEILGNGGLYSINYERSLNTKLYGRIGFSTFLSFDLLGGDTGGRITTIPVLLSYFSGQKKNHFEISGGMLFGKVNTDLVSGAIIDLTSFIGYRYQAPGKGFLFRVGITPFLSLDKKANYPDKGLSLSGGISWGYHF